ncbi:MAG: TatD family hydrolase [Clostridia bacterium]
MIFDSHAHYDDKQFDEDRESLLGSLLPQKDVIGIINCATTIDTIAMTIDMCEKYSYIFGTAGIHPECADNLPANYLELIEKACAHKKIVAVGEIGLDYFYEDMCPKETQKKVFVEQIELAKKLDLPIVVHDRDAHQDTMDILRKYKAKGVVHCFSGSKEMAIETVKMGYYLGIGGVVTFKNSRHVKEVVSAIPMEKLLLETDAPYLSPVPFRGKRNDSSLIAYTASQIAQLKNISTTEVLNASYQNTKDLFGKIF